MALPQDSAPKFQEYAHPEMIVSTEWVAQHLDDPGLVVAESDEDVLLYETGHVPGAVKLDWHTELNDPVTRDYVDGAGFARLMSEKGISRDTTLVLYGDKNNWWAAYALWVCSLFGHHQAGVVEVLRDPLGGDDHLRVGVLLELRRGILRQRHRSPPLIIAGRLVAGRLAL